MSQPIVDRVLGSSALPSMPYAAMRVVELTQKDDVSVNEITQVIRTDPALTAKLLQTANSPLFGLAKKVGSLEQATVTLGLRAVKVMALSFSLVEALRTSQGGDFDYRRYWRRSLTTAVAAKLIAEEHGKVRKDECFVGGLLSDIGMLAAYRCVPELYGPVLEQLEMAPRPIQDVEAELLGVTHAQISAAMMRSWSLPDMLCDALAAHHGEGIDALPDRPRMIAAVLDAASSIAELLSGDVDAGQVDAVKARCVKLLPMAPDAFERIVEELQASVEEMAALFQVEIGQAISLEALRTQAMVQLAHISISAEVDRAQAVSRADEVQQKLAEASHQAATDGLTGVANRRAFDEHLAGALTRARGAGGSVGMILIDLDHFKALNDTYGHQAGDEALRQVGGCLREHCREPALPARFGGEEFAVVLTDVTQRALETLAEHVRDAIECIRFQHGDRRIRFTASLGAVHVDVRSQPAVTAADIIERADKCLYQAKRNGRNRIVLAF